ncbi:MAG: hypothetical protein ACK5YR_22485 [Pirellula sp.]|jgi:hypothetical protein
MPVGELETLQQAKVAWRLNRTWSNRFAVMLAVCFLVAVIVFVGKLPIGGSIAVSGDQSDRFGEIMKANGVMLWTGIGSLGMMRVPFDNPFALLAVDDEVMADARRHGYRAIIEYKCVIPYFNHRVDSKYL